MRCFVCYRDEHTCYFSFRSKERIWKIRTSSRFHKVGKHFLLNL